MTDNKEAVESFYSGAEAESEVEDGGFNKVGANLHP